MSEDDDERELKVSLMRADIANKEADTVYKQGLAKYEPWKLVFGGAAAGAAMLGAGAGLMAGFLALSNYLHPPIIQPPPPPPQIIFQPGSVVVQPPAPPK